MSIFLFVGFLLPFEPPIDSYCRFNSLYSAFSKKRYKRDLVGFLFAFSNCVTQFLAHCYLLLTIVIIILFLPTCFVIFVCFQFHVCVCVNCSQQKQILFKFSRLRVVCVCWVFVSELNNQEIICAKCLWSPGSEIYLTGLPSARSSPTHFSLPWFGC